MAAQSPVTSTELAATIQVTSRTIRNDLKQLSSELKINGASIVPLKGKGYELKIDDERLFKQLLKGIVGNGEEGLPVEPEDRVKYLVKMLLIQVDYVKLDDIADELFISRSTLQNDLRDVKVIFKKYGLSVNKKPNFGIKVKGEEREIRFCMAECLFDRKYELIEMSDSLSILPPNEISVIKSSILENSKKYNISLSDISLKNLLIHIIIACKRVRETNFIYIVESDINDILEQKEFKIANELIRDIEQKLNLCFPRNEIAYVAMHLLGTKLLITPSFGKDELNKHINKAALDLVREMVKDVERELKLGIMDDQEMLVALTLHLKPAINRYKYQMNLRNPMLMAIKTNYPLAFEAAVIAGRTIKRKIDIQIDENEIGYLALHFGAAIERSTITKKPRNCLIVCATGVGSAQLLYYKLRSQFENELKIVGTSEYYNLDNQSLDNIDLVISTIPLPDKLNVPSIVVSSILGGSDMKKIKDYISNSNKHVNKFLEEEYIFLQQDLTTKEEVIDLLCKKLIENQLVNDGYVESVLKREEASPTSFGNLVAIPHPLTPQTDTTFWIICTLKKPIDWGGKQVQLICLLNISSANTEDLKPMYEKLVSIVDDFNMVQQLVQCESTSHFLKIMNSKS